MRIGIYMDFAYFADADGISADQAVVLFALGVGAHVGEVTVFGRLTPEPGRAPYPVAGDHVRYVALPHYGSLTELGGVGRAIRRSCAIFEAQLSRLDAVWLFLPAPLAMVFAAIARRRGVPVILGQRQDTPQYIINRLPNRRWLWAVPLAHGLDRAQRLAARRVPTTVVGHELGKKFGAGRNPVLEMGVSLVRRAGLASLETAQAKAWDGELRLLSVGRLEPEKNPTLLVDIVADLRARDPRWSLDVAGDGPLEEAVHARAEDLGVTDAVRLHGYVANGPALQELYRGAHAFIHVSLTEGLPQVLFEAHAAGLPIVATDVGGVGDALAGGRTGLLVAPRDAAVPARALERLRDDPALRRELIAAGLRSVRAQTMEVQIERVGAFIAEHAAVRTAPARGASRAGRTRRRSRVLMYHDVSAGPGEDPGGFSGAAAARYQIDLGRFEEHLDLIEASGLTVGLLQPTGAGAPVAMTFDDGGNSGLRIADALERRGWRGHFFVTTSLLGTPRFLDREGARELVRRGHVVGSHSHTHPDAIGALPAERILDEWRRSREALEETVGEPPAFASVPGGALSAAVISSAAQAGYRVLLTSEPSPRVRRHGDLAVLGRYAIRAGTSSDRVAGYASGSPLACGAQRLTWEAKTAAKRVAPRAYRAATRAAARSAGDA